MKFIEIFFLFSSLDYNEIEKQLIIGYCDRTIRLFSATISEEFDARLTGRIILKNVFSIAEQIYTISTTRLSVKDYELIVAQPGGNIIRFNPNDENSKKKSNKTKMNRYSFFSSVRVVATDLCNNGLIGWTEAVAVEKFFDETTYASVCQGLSQRISFRYIIDEKKNNFLLQIVLIFIPVN